MGPRWNDPDWGSIFGGAGLFQCQSVIRIGEWYIYIEWCELIVWLNIPTLKLNGTTSPSSGAKMASECLCSDQRIHFSWTNLGCDMVPWISHQNVLRRSKGPPVLGNWCDLPLLPLNPGSTQSWLTFCTTNLEQIGNRWRLAWFYPRGPVFEWYPQVMLGMNMGRWWC